MVGVNKNWKQHETTFSTPSGNGWGSSFLGIEMKNFEHISQRIMDVFPHVDAPELPLHCTKTARGSLKFRPAGPAHRNTKANNFQAAME
jgi:hypothetical protein